MADIIVGVDSDYDYTVQKDKSFSWLVADTVSLVGYICRVSDTYDIFIEQIIKAKGIDPLLFALYKKQVALFNCHLRFQLGCFTIISFVHFAEITNIVKTTSFGDFGQLNVRIIFNHIVCIPETYSYKCIKNG